MKIICCSLQQLLMAISFLTAPAVLNAQGTSASTGNTNQTETTVMSDTAFISKNIMDNETEIQLARLGTQKSFDPQIKNLSQQMVSDHTEILNDLRKVARQKNMSVSAETNQPGLSPAGTSSSRVGTIIDAPRRIGTSAASETGAITSGSGSSGLTGGAGLSAATSPTKMGASGSHVTPASGSATVNNGSGLSNGNRIEGKSITTGSGTNMPGTGAINSGTGVTSGNAAGISRIGSGTNMPGAVIPSRGMNTPGMSRGVGALASGKRTATPSMGGIEIFDALKSAPASQFNSLYVSQMLTMHEAKIEELQTALRRISDPILKTAVTEALPKIRFHRDILVRLNRGTTRGAQSIGSNSQ